MLATLLVSAAVALAAVHPLREVSIANIGAEEPLAVLLVPSGPNCDGPPAMVPLPRTFRGGGRVAVGDRLAGACGEKAGMAVFSGDRAAVRLTAAQLKAAGTRLRIELKETPKLPIQVWFASPELEYHAKDEIAYADWMLRRSLAGVRLAAEFTLLEDEARRSISAADEGLTETEELEPDCSAARRSSAYRKDRINIYYGLHINNTCVSGDVVFVVDPPQLGILAHELGHALGVSSGDGDPLRRYVKGHAPGSEDTPAPFDGANAMWKGSLIFRDWFSLGQVFWINFNAESRLCQQRGNCLPCRDGKGGCPLFRGDPRPASRAAPGTTIRPLGGACPPDAVARAVTRALTPEGVRLALAGQLIDTPRFCTAKDMRDTLRRRFDEVCDTAGGGCGSADADQFVQRWRDQTASAIAAWVSDSAAKIFATRFLAGTPCDADKGCRVRARQMERAVIGYVGSRLVTGLDGKRILWVEDAARVEPEARVFRTLLLSIDFVADAGAAERALSDPSKRFAVIVAGAANGDTIRPQQDGPPVVTYRPGAKDRSGDPFELYNQVIGRVVTSR